MPSVRYPQAIRPALVAAGVLLLFAASAQACPVCFGNAESKLTQGAQAGVVLMLGVVYAVLLGFASVTAFWFIRAQVKQRRLQKSPFL